jgi:T4-like virus tail tube protein gp19
MAFNVNDIRAQLTFGGARPNLFQVIITNPVNPVADIKLPFLCKAAQLPSSQLGLIEVPYFGRKLKIAGDRTFDAWTVNIINDEDFLIRNAMEQWNNSIQLYQQNVTALGTGAPSLYKSQATVTQYGKAGEILRTYQFNGIFPQAISAIELAWNDTDTIEEFQVQFQYDTFEIVPGVTGNAGGA